jgi:hypothetical protein
LTKTKTAKKSAGASIPGPLRNRIVGSGEADPADLLANPKNWRTHSKEQEAALEGLLDEVGWVSRILINKRTGNMIDGHLRVQIAKKRKERKVPFDYVDLSPAEEDLVLAALDPVGDLAGIDAAKLDELLGGLDPKSIALAAMLHDIEKELGLDGGGGEDVETLLDQAVQLEPAREFIVVMCESAEEWEKLRAALALRTVRRGGYKPGSPFDATGTERVLPAARLLKRLGGKC